MHPFDHALLLTPLADGRLAGQTSDHYWNFAGPFGGYVAALLMQAVLLDERRLGPPVAQTVNYCGAMSKGAFEIAVSMDRGGKATQHWSVRLTQGDLVMATATIVCANRRETFAHTAVVLRLFRRRRPLLPRWRLTGACHGWPPMISASSKAGRTLAPTPRALVILAAPRTMLWLSD